MQMFESPATASPALTVPEITECAFTKIRAFVGIKSLFNFYTIVFANRYNAILDEIVKIVNGENKHHDIVELLRRMMVESGSLSTEEFERKINMSYTHDFLVCKDPTCAKLRKEIFDPERIRNYQIYYEFKEEIKSQIRALPRELREMIMAKTLPAKIILQYMPHDTATATVRNMPQDYFGDQFQFDHYRGAWIPHDTVICNTFYSRMHNVRTNPQPFDPTDPARNVIETTPLDVAIRVKNEKAIEFYLSYFVSPEYQEAFAARAANCNGTIARAAGAAGNTGDASEIKYLRSHTLQFAANYGSPELFYKISALLPTKARDSEFRDAFIILVRRQRTELIKALVADKDIATLNIITWLYRWGLYDSYKYKDYIDKLFIELVVKRTNPGESQQDIFGFVIEYKLTTPYKLLIAHGWAHPYTMEEAINMNSAFLFEILYDGDHEGVFEVLRNARFPACPTKLFFSYNFEITLWHIRNLYFYKKDKSKLLYDIVKKYWQAQQRPGDNNVYSIEEYKKIIKQSMY